MIAGRLRLEVDLGHIDATEARLWQIAKSRAQGLPWSFALLPLSLGSS